MRLFGPSKQRKLKKISKALVRSSRSVSMIMSPYSHVFFANDLAPIFLQDLIGKTGNGWDQY